MITVLGLSINELNEINMLKSSYFLMAFLCLQLFFSDRILAEINDGIVEGKVVDKTNRLPVEFANIAIYTTNGELIKGGITNIEGEFSIKNIKPGEYVLIAKFIGYDETKISNLLITTEARKFDLGIIELNNNIAELEGIEVIAEKKAIQYKIDKKIINPSQYLSTSGGSAVDILANTPSITVDIEGNVSMRGSSNFTVLIDGKPTPFEATDALEQVPASQIENIEIITNPSAKYDPDGTAGIINIVTKKKFLKGINGIVNLDANSLGSLNGDFLLNFQREKYSFFIGGNRSDRKREGLYNTRTETYLNDTTYITEQDGTGERGFSSNSIKTGINFNLDPKTSLSLNLSAGTNQRKYLNDADYEVWYLHNNISSEIEELKTQNSNISNGKFISGDINFEKKFEKEGHLIQSNFFYQTESSKENALNDQQKNNAFFSGQESWENGSGQEFRFKTDYMLSVNTFFNVESGYQWRLDKEDEWYDLYVYASANENYEPNSTSSNYKTSDFTRHIHSLYTTLGGEWNRLGYKLGLRGEYTNREILFSARPDPYTIDRFDFFPSMHLSYKLPAELQLMASYSRRIERPRSYYLEPFETWRDAYSVRQGNPDLQPEYINSYELGIQKSFKKGFLSLETFFRETENKIDRINSIYISNGDTLKNIILSKSENVGKDFALGIEGMLNYEFNSWWSMNLNGNTFLYRVESKINNRIIERESNNWGLRFSNTFKPTKNNRIQFDVMYRSPTVEAQGERDGFMFTNMAVRQDFFKRRLSATFSVQDVLNTAKFHMTSEGEGFKNERTYDMASPVFQLQLSYKINNFNPERRRSGNGEGGDMEMEGGF